MTKLEYLLMYQKADLKKQQLENNLRTTESRQKLNKITTGRKEPDLEEVYQISHVLSQPIDVVANIFLRYKSPNGVLGG